MEKTLVKLFDDWFTVERIDSMTYTIKRIWTLEKVNFYLVIGDNSATLTIS